MSSKDILSYFLGFFKNEKENKYMTTPVGGFGFFDGAVVDLKMSEKSEKS